MISLTQWYGFVQFNVDSLGTTDSRDAGMTKIMAICRTSGKPNDIHSLEAQESKTVVFDTVCDPMEILDTTSAAYTLTPR